MKNIYKTNKLGRKQKLITMLICFLFLFLFSQNCWSANWFVDPSGTDDVTHGTTSGTGAFLTIQYAISASSSGDVINVGVGTYVETGQIVVNKNLSIVGSDKTTTIIKPFQSTGSSGDAVGWFLVNTGITFNMSNVTLDGTGMLIWDAIHHHGNGTIDNCIFTQIKYNESTTYRGAGVRKLDAGIVDVTNCSFSQMGRNGIIYIDGGTGTVSGNTYVGKGVGNWLDYAIDLEYGGVATINNNNISNNLGIATVDGSGSAGITVWDDPGVGATITNNTFTNNTIGFAVAMYGGTTPTVVIGAGNLFDGGETGVEFQCLDVTGTPNVTFGASTFKGQTIAAISLQNGISSGSVFDISSCVFKTAGDVVITDNGAKEDLVIHAIDAANRALLIWNSNNVYVTTNSFVTPTTTAASIQRAINVASSGWTVNVSAGTYSENVNITKSITLKGAKVGVDARTRTFTGESILDGTGLPTSTYDAIKISNGVSNVTIDGFEIRNYAGSGSNGDGNAISSYCMGSNTSGSANVTVQNNYIHDVAYNGILVGSENNTSTDMVVQSGWIIQKNKLSGFKYAGIELTNVINSQVKDNVIAAPTAVFDDPGDAGVGIEIAARSRAKQVTAGTNNIVSSNTITGTFPAGSRTAINVLARSYQASVSNATLSGLTITNNTISGATNVRAAILLVAESRNNRPALVSTIDINNNTLDGNSDGITIQDYVNGSGTPTHNNISITSNDIKNNTNIGIHTLASTSASGISIENNKITSNALFGIKNEGTGTIIALNNYWGDVSGSYNLTLNPSGLGNAVSDNITFIPWWCDAAMTTKCSPITPGNAIININTGAQFAANDLSGALTAATDGQTLYIVPGVPVGGTIYNIPGKTVYISGSGIPGQSVLTGASPALTVTAGDVIVQNGIEFSNNATNEPTILVTGGSLKLRNCIINETNQGNNSCIKVTGGTVDAGASVSDPGNNKFKVNLPGSGIDNEQAVNLYAIGNNWSSPTGPTIASNPSGTGCAIISSISGDEDYVLYTPFSTSGPTLTGIPYPGTTGTNACKIDAATTAPFSAADAIQGYTSDCGGVLTATLTNTVITGTNCGWTITYTFSVEDECSNILTNQSYSNSGRDQTPPVLTGTPYAQVGTINSCKPTDDLQAGSLFSQSNAILGYSDNCTPNLHAYLTLATLAGNDCNWTVVYTYKITDGCNNELNGQTYSQTGGNTNQPTLTGTPYAGLFGVNACKVNAETAAPFNAAHAIEGYSASCGSTVTATLTNTVVTGTNCGWVVNYTFNVSDICGNTLTNQTYSNTGSDQTAPTLTGTPYAGTTGTNACYSNASSVVSFDAANAIQGYTDNCSGIVTATLTNTTVTGTDADWTVTYTFTITDLCNNALTNQTYSDKGSDQTNPSITCISDQLRCATTTEITYTTIGTEFNPTSFSDNCSTPSIAYVLTGATIGSGNTTLNGVVFNIGVTTVTWTVTDNAGNHVSCSFTVTVYTSAVANAGGDQNICGNSTTLAATPPPFSTTGTWTYVSGPSIPTFTDINLYNTNVSGLVQGTYILKWSIVSGSCFPSTDEVTLHVYTIPVVSNVTMQYSINGGSSWASVDGTFAGGYNMCIDGNTSSHYLLDINTFSLISGTLQIGTMNAFRLTHENNSAAYFAYWAGRGVTATSSLPWQIEMWKIINGIDPFFYVVYTGTDYILVDGLQYFLAGNTGTPILTLPGDYPQDFYTFTGNVTNTDGCTSANFNVIMNFNTIPVVSDVTMQYSTNGGSSWSSVGGTFVGGYNMCIDGNTSSHYLLDINTFALATGTLQTGTMNDFRLTHENNSAAYFAYWAGRGVTATSSLPWQIEMWKIINGVDPFFYVVYTGTDYILVDGLQYFLAGNTGTPILTLPGDYPQDFYTFTGNVTNTNGCTSANFNVIMNFNTMPTANAGSDQSFCSDFTTSTLHANTPLVGTGSWSQVSGPGTAIFANPSSPNSGISSLVFGAYKFRWTITNGTCSNYSDVNVNLVKCVDLGVTKTLTDPNPLHPHHHIHKYDTVTFTIVLKNYSTNTASNNIELLDTLPSVFHYISSTTTAGTYNNSTGIWAIATLAAQDSAVLIVRARVDTSAQNNVCIISQSYPDSNPLNNCSFASVTAKHSSSGHHGGLESNGNLVSKVALRNFINHKNGELNYNSTKNLDMFVDIQTKTSSSLSSQSDLSSFIPTSGPLGSVGYVSTPTDLIGITNATEVLSVDYFTDSTERQSSILGVATNPSTVYEHTKMVCDRLNGARLEEVNYVSIKGHPFYIARLVQDNGDVDYTVNFIAYKNGTNYNIDNQWSLDNYHPTGNNPVLNFQVWAISEVYTLKLAEQIFDKMTGLGYSLNMATTAPVFPSVYVVSGNYQNGSINMLLKNSIAANSLQVTGTTATIENGSRTNFNQSITIPSTAVGQASIPTGNIFDFGFKLTNSINTSSDVLYFADGSWGYDADTMGSSVNSFSISALNNISYPNSLNLLRNVILDGKVLNNVSLFRDLRAGNKAVDVSNYKYVEFNASGTGYFDLILSKKGITTWANQYKIPVNLTTTKSHYKIALADLANNMGLTNFTGNDVIAVVFNKNGNYSTYQDFNLNVSELHFSGNILNIEQLNKNNKDVKLTIYPNPASQQTVISFNLPESTKLKISLYNNQGKLITVINEGQYIAGDHVVNFNAANYDSGIYLMKFETENYLLHEKMVIMR